MCKLLSLLLYAVNRLVLMAFICIYLFVGSMFCVIIVSMGYGAFKETIKFYNGEKSQ
jgi:hypothetical protein